MVDVISIEGVNGLFSPTDRQYIHDGEYFRIPDGRVFLLKSYSPETVIVQVNLSDVPEWREIIELVDYPNS